MCSTMCTVNKDVSPMSWIGHPRPPQKATSARYHCHMARGRRRRIGARTGEAAVGVPVAEGEGEGQQPRRRNGDETGGSRQPPMASGPEAERMIVYRARGQDETGR